MDTRTHTRNTDKRGPNTSIAAYTPTHSNKYTNARAANRLPATLRYPGHPQVGQRRTPHVSVMIASQPTNNSVLAK